MDLADLRHALRGGERPFPQRSLVFLRLDVDDDVAFGQRPMHGRLDRVGGCMTLTDRGAGRDPDDDVRKLPCARLAHSQAPKLHRWLEGPDRPRGNHRGLGRNPVHEDVHVAAHQPGGGRQHEQGHEERSSGVGFLPTRANGEQTAEKRN